MRAHPFDALLRHTIVNIERMKTKRHVVSLVGNNLAWEKMQSQYTQPEISRSSSSILSEYSRVFDLKYVAVIDKYN